MRRSYDLEVVAKFAGTHGFGLITLRAPSVDGASVDLGRPWWFDRTHQGAPVTVDVSPEEWAAIEVGTLFRVTLEQLVRVGDVT